MMQTALWLGTGLARRAPSSCEMVITESCKFTTIVGVYFSTFISNRLEDRDRTIGDWGEDIGDLPVNFQTGIGFISLGIGQLLNIFIELCERHCRLALSINRAHMIRRRSLAGYAGGEIFSANSLSAAPTSASNLFSSSSPTS